MYQKLNEHLENVFTVFSGVLPTPEYSSRRVKLTAALTIDTWHWCIPCVFHLQPSIYVTTHNTTVVTNIYCILELGL